MKTSFLFVFLLFSSLNFAQDFVIKSLKTYSNNGKGKSKQAAFPIIDKKSRVQNSIIIEFDIDADYEPRLNIIFRFCDEKWNPYDNLFLDNQLYNTEYNLSFNKLPLNVRGARYHYRGKFPSKDVTFPFSGKWLYNIVDSNNRDEIYAGGYFIAVDPEIFLRGSIKKDRLEGENPYPSVLGRAYNISASFFLPDSLHPSRVKNIEIIKNQEIFESEIVNRDLLSTKRFYDWDGDRKFTFTARDIKPGKEYRRLDLLDRYKYDPPKTRAHFEGVEISRFFEPNKIRDNFGGSILKGYKNEYSEYMDVLFELRLPADFYKDVFVTGSFSDWEVYPDMKLQNNDGIYSTSVELKRGVYDYQYVTGEINDGIVENIDWVELEGNDWGTDNEYRIFLHYDSPENGGYDKIIGYIKLYSGGL